MSISISKMVGIIQTMMSISVSKEYYNNAVLYCMLWYAMICYAISLMYYRLKSTSWIGAVDIGDDAIVNDRCVVIPNTASNFLPDSGPRSLANWRTSSSGFPALARNFWSDRTISLETSWEEYSVSRTFSRTPTAWDNRVPLASNVSWRCPTSLASCNSTLPPSSCKQNKCRSKSFVRREIFQSKVI